MDGLGKNVLGVEDNRYEYISRKLWFAIVLVTIASIILSFEGNGAFTFNKG